MADLREMTLGQLLDDTASKYPDNDAVVYVDRDYRLTYREFAELTDDVAKGLLALGIERGEKLAIWATNVPYWPVLMFAAAKVGAVLLTVNTNYKTTELAYLLANSQAENLFLIEGYRDTDYVGTIYGLAPEMRTDPRGQLNAAALPHLKRVILLGPEKQRGMYSMAEIISLGRTVSNEDLRARQAKLSPHDVVNMQYTSGTTGFPKGVMLTHHSILNNGYWIGKNQGFTHKDRLCLPVPLFHCFGCVLGVMAAINHGTTLVILETFDPVQVMASVDQEKCTALYGVPTMFIAILEHKLFNRFDYSSLRTGIMAGSPCPVEVMKKVMERMHMTDITICYGLTESSPVMTQTRMDDGIKERTESVGRSMPQVEVQIQDPVTRTPLPYGTHGEVCCRGYLVMKGYYGNPKATAEAIDTDGWLHSGDLGVMDERGYLSITGRLKDMIIRGGENIYPREVEEFLYTMPGISDVQVVGVASRKYGEEVGAFIILKPGATMAPEDVRFYCRGKISFHKIPKYVAFVDSYPMTASGKVQKYLLRQKATELWPEAMEEPKKI